MGEGVIAGIVSVIAALVGQMRITSRPDRTRKRIQATLQLLKELDGAPELADTRTRITGLIDEQADYLARLERKGMERKYDPSQPFIAALFAVPAGYGAYRLWGLTEWYWKGAAVGLWLFVGLLIYVGISGFLTPPRTKKETPETNDA